MYDPIKEAIFQAAKERKDKPRHYLGMSEIGDPCSRRLWLKFRGVIPITFDGKLILIFEMGDYVEWSIIEKLEKAGYKVFDRQEEYSDYNGHFKGHNDGKIVVETEPHQLEIKSCNDKKFKMFKKHGVKEVEPRYYFQEQSYMGYSGINKSIFIFQNKNNCDIHTELVDFDPSAFDTLMNKAKSIIESPYPPVYGYPLESIECEEWCDYRLSCRQMKAGIMASEICYSCGHCNHGIMPFCKYHKKDITVKGVKCDKWESMFTKKWIETEGKRYPIK